MSALFPIVFFDVDSTLVTIEGIDVLAGGNPAVAALTDAAMNGEIAIDEVYARRLEMIRPARSRVTDLAGQYRRSLVPGAAETLQALRKISGIGEWTAQYLAMRALAWPDAFPHTDLGIRKALGEPNAKKVLQLAEKWRPWRAYAAVHLWINVSNVSHPPYELIHDSSVPAR